MVLDRTVAAADHVGSRHAEVGRLPDVGLGLECSLALVEHRSPVADNLADRTVLAGRNRFGCTGLDHMVAGRSLAVVAVRSLAVHSLAVRNLADHSLAGHIAGCSGRSLDRKGQTSWVVELRLLIGRCDNVWYVREFDVMGYDGEQ